ncbi:MAG: LCP family protein [Candidatus Margulisbacteria bacterium]|nr:LCP family protein [Candidatus Margulisiibacteriota bacterium]
MKRKVDQNRLAAVCLILLAIIYFYFNIFAPRWIPNFLRVGILRKPTNVLILGTDMTFASVTQQALPKVNARADTIVLLHADPIVGKINILSIPRDTLAAVPGYWPTKINAANAYGGSSLMVKTVENLTGTRIDYYIELRPQALIKIVNLLGGVKIYVEKDMRYVDRAQHLDINLKEGWQKLSGNQAHQYIRFRHDLFGDIGRVERQQKFFSALTQSLKKPSNIIKAPLAIILSLRELDTNMPLNQAIRLINFSRMAKITAYTASGEAANLPVVGSVWILDMTAFKQTIREHF